LKTRCHDREASSFPRGDKIASCCGRDFDTAS